MAKAKEEIDTAIAFDQAHKVQILIQSFGNQLSQKEKNKYLLNYYARPQSAPLLLAIGADEDIHFNCSCLQSRNSGLPNQRYQESILHMAAECGNWGVVQALLKYKAIVDARDTHTQETSLMKVCRIRAIDYYRWDRRYLGDYITIIEDLIETGADQSLTNKERKTALQIAQTEIEDLKKREIIVKYLSCQKLK